MINKIRIITQGTSTKIFLDDQEVSGCIAANIEYRPYELPVVQLELTALEIEAEAEKAEVCKTVYEPIEALGLPKKTIQILHDGYWWNKNGEQQCDPVLTVDYLVRKYLMGHLGKYKGLGPSRISNIIRALKERELI